MTKKEPSPTAKRQSEGVIASDGEMSYFRCTHKYDQGCQSTKQVQKSEEGPSMHLITYIGEHTCKNLNLIPNIIMPSISISEPSIVLQEFPLPSSPLFSKRQEGEEEVLSNLNHGTTASSECFDLLNPCEGSLLDPDQATPDHGDESSGLDMSFIDDLLSFDQGSLFRD